MTDTELSMVDAVRLALARSMESDDNVIILG